MCSSSIRGSEKVASAPERCHLRTFIRLNDTDAANFLIDVVLMDPNSLSLNRVARDRSVAVLPERSRKVKFEDGPWVLAKLNTITGSQV